MLGKHLYDKTDTLVEKNAQWDFSNNNNGKVKVSSSALDVTVRTFAFQRGVSYAMLALRFDEGLTLEMSAFATPSGGQFTFIYQLSW